MKVLFEKSFLRDLKKVNNPSAYEKGSQIIKNIKSSDSIHILTKIRKLEGHPSAFRIRMGVLPAWIIL